MTTMSGEGDSVPTSGDARAELCYKLSQMARNRFNTRMSYEWKMCFGLWAGFGAAAGFVIGSESAPDQPALWFLATLVAAIAAAFVVVAFHKVWKHLYKSYDRDRKTAYYWESAIETVATAGDSSNLLPKELWPSDNKENFWRRYGSNEGTAEPRDDAWKDAVPYWQRVITFVFAALFVLSFLFRGIASLTPASARPEVRITGYSDVDAKAKVGARP